MHLRSLLLLALTIAAPAWAQYPAKPIRLVVPYTPGASNDTLSRATAQAMSPILGQSRNPRAGTENRGPAPRQASAASAVTA